MAHYLKLEHCVIFLDYSLQGQGHSEGSGFECEVSWSIAILVLWPVVFVYTDGADQGLGLDTFLAKHTSEDNASFTDILVESERRRKEKHAWLFEKEDVQDQVTAK